MKRAIERHLIGSGVARCMFGIDAETDKSAAAVATRAHQGSLAAGRDDGVSGERLTDGVEHAATLLVKRGQA